MIIFLPTVSTAVLNRGARQLLTVGIGIDVAHGGDCRAGKSNKYSSYGSA